MMSQLTASIADYFCLLKKQGILGSSYLFVGSNQQLISDVIKTVICAEDERFCGVCWDCKHIEQENHPDLFVVKPEPNYIKIADIRNAQGFLALKSFRARYKVLFVLGGELFGIEAANAFLKTLEEPPKNSFILIQASQLEGIIPTIISRCRKIFIPSQEPEHREDFEQMRLFLNGERVKFGNRERLKNFLWGLMLIFHSKIIQEASGVNRLLPGQEYEIISKHYTIEELQNIIDKIFEIYSVVTTVNENLALTMIQESL